MKFLENVDSLHGEWILNIKQKTESSRITNVSILFNHVASCIMYVQNFLYMHIMMFIFQNEIS